MTILEKTVVVVDDSPTSLRFAADTLREAGFSVTTAVDAEEGLEVINSCMPDIVVLDIILPKKNGFQVLSRAEDKRGDEGYQNRSAQQQEPRDRSVLGSTARSRRVHHQAGATSRLNGHC